MTVATNENHGLERYLRSAKIYNINVEVLGSGKEWTGGDMHYPGGGQKVNLLKDKLNTLSKEETEEDKKNHIVLFTDRFVIFFKYPFSFYLLNEIGFIGV